jgi:hypothetical protein
MRVGARAGNYLAPGRQRADHGTRSRQGLALQSLAPRLAQTQHVFLRAMSAAPVEPEAAERELVIANARKNLLVVLQYIDATEPWGLSLPTLCSAFALGADNTTADSIEHFMDTAVWQLKRNGLVRVHFRASQMGRTKRIFAWIRATEAGTRAAQAESLPAEFEFEPYEFDPNS